MNRYEVLLTLEDLEKDDNPEVCIAYCTQVVNQQNAGPQEVLSHRVVDATYLVSTAKNGIYDKVDRHVDANGDGIIGDPQDQQILSALATAFARLNLEASDRPIEEPEEEKENPEAPEEEKEEGEAPEEEVEAGHRQIKEPAQPPFERRKTPR